MKPPSILIVTNRGHLVAYRPTETGSLEVVDEVYFEEGNSKLSELVTDQAGAFPVSGSTGTASAERLPLITELEVRCFHSIATRIAAILKREDCRRWGLAAPSEINNAIVEHLGKESREGIVANLKLDLTNSPKDDVRNRFEKAATGFQTAT